jgi:UDP-glucuronate 4-epimerase
MERVFTYVDGIVEGAVRVNDNSQGPERPDSYFGEIPFRIYNIGNHEPVELEVLIETLEKHLDKKAIRNMKEMQPGDVLETYADTNDLQKYFGFKPNTPLDTGIERFVKWYKEYNR